MVDEVEEEKGQTEETKTNPIYPNISKYIQISSKEFKQYQIISNNIA